MGKKNIILSGGGTGGHIFPAISIARKIKELLPDTDILFVGAKGKMEMEKVPKAGFPIKGLPVSGFHRRLTLKNLSFLFKLVASLIKANKIVKSYKPDLVIGTGGFASGPIVKAASSKGIPCLLQEQNAFPGVTNRMLGKKVNTICVAHEGLQQYFPASKIKLTGNPVREDIIKKSGDRKEALEFFGLEEGKPVVFVFGGSLGARTINQAIEGHLGDIASKNLNLIWQTGTSFFNEAKDAALREGVDQIKAHDFIYRMDLAYELADIIISRAGAISISELCIVGKPVILVPYPHAAGDHQMKNAMSLVDKNAAIMIEDHKAKDELVDEIVGLLNDKKKMEDLGSNIKAMAMPEATSKIAEQALKLLKL